MLDRVPDQVPRNLIKEIWICPLYSRIMYSQQLLMLTMTNNEIFNAYAGCSTSRLKNVVMLICVHGKRDAPDKSCASKPSYVHSP